VVDLLPGFLVFIVSAPSGSGKSTLVRELLRVVPRLEFSISYTTRAPRGSEQNGREYFFVSREQFERMIDERDFLEYAEVFGNYYGTAWSFLADAQKKGNDLLLDIDVQGAEIVRGKLSQAVSIFIAPPDRKTLEWRLRHRGLDSPAVIQRRLHDASREIAAYNKYDYVLINDDLQQSVDRLRAIVLTERTKARGASADDAPPNDTRRLAEVASTCLRENISVRIEPVLRSFNLSSGIA
jgi:guanylate kinase